MHLASNSASGEPRVAHIFLAHHGGTESTERGFFFARSGDPRGIGFAFHRAGDNRAKERSPPGTVASPKGHIRQSVMD